MTTWCHETRARDGHESDHHLGAIAVNSPSTIFIFIIIIIIIKK